MLALPDTKRIPKLLGRNKGGFTTKIHAFVDALGNPLKFILIPSPVSNKTNEKELFLPITGELSKFITCSICLPNNEYWYYSWPEE